MNETRRSETSADTGEAGLRIGAVAKLTGLSVHTLRKWEDRYDAVQPKRSAGGERLYTREDLKRLSLIRRLSMAGMSLRDLAGLGLEALEETWERLSGQSPAAGIADDPERVLRVAAVGATVPRSLGRTQLGRLDLIASASTASALYEALGGSRVDVVIGEFQTVQPEMQLRIDELLERTGARAAVIVYGFAAGPTLEALRRRSVVLLRAPADPHDLERAARDAVAEAGAPLPWSGDPSHAATGDAPPPPTLSLETVARVAELSPRIRCECPRHIADLLFGLRAFEEYSAQCESRDVEDRALHHYLWETSGRARAMFEEALVRVAHAEGIELE